VCQVFEFLKSIFLPGFINLRESIEALGIMTYSHFLPPPPYRLPEFVGGGKGGCCFHA